MATLGSLVVSLEANMAQFNDNMQRASATAQQAMALVEGATARAAESVKLVGMAAAGIAAGVSMQALINQFDKAVESAAGLKDMAEKTGASVESLSALSSVAKAVGQDMTGVETALTKLAKNLAGSDDEAKGTAHALDTLGLKMKDLRQMDAAEAFKAVADKLAEYKDGVGKTAIAQDILGKSGAQLLPYMKDLAEAGVLVAKTTSQQAALADDYEKNLRKLVGAKNSLYKAISMEVLPAANNFIESLLGIKAKTDDATEALRSLVKDGTLRQWSQDAADSAASMVKGSVEAVRSLRDHKDAIEAVVLAYAALRGGATLGPWITEMGRAAAAQVQMVATAYSAKAVTEMQARAAMENAAAKLAEVEASLAAARASVIGAEGNVKLLYTVNSLIPAERARAAALAQLTTATLAHAEAQNAASLAGRTAAAAAAASTSVISALGGPVGVLSALLIAGAGAWTLWGNEASKAATEAQQAKSDIERAINTLERLKRIRMFGAGDEGELNAGLEKVQEQISVLVQSRSPEAAQKLAELRKQEAQIQQAIYELAKMKPTQDETPQKDLGGYRSNLGTANSAKEAADDYERLMKSIREKIAVQEMELSTQGKLTEAAKEYAKFQIDVKEGFVKVSGGELTRLNAQWDAFLKNAEQLQARARQLAYETARLSVLDIGASFNRDTQARIDSMAILPALMREQEAALRGVDEKAREAEKNLRRLFADGKIDAEQYTAVMQELNDVITAQKNAVEAAFDMQERLNGSWEYGAHRSLQDYADTAKNVASQAQDAMKRAFTGMEDALVGFVKTGKLSFTSLADSIITDLIRIQIRQQMAGMMANSGGLLSAVSSFLGSSSSSASADSGNVAQGLKLPSFDVGTDVVPKDMIAMIHQGEMIVPKAYNPNAGGAATGGGKVVVNVVESPGNGGQVQQSQGPGGVDVITVLVERVKGAVAGDIAKSGNIAKIMEQRYGLSPAMGAVR